MTVRIKRSTLLAALPEVFAIFPADVKIPHLSASARMRMSWERTASQMKRSTELVSRRYGITTERSRNHKKAA